MGFIIQKLSTGVIFILSFTYIMIPYLDMDTAPHHEVQTYFLQCMKEGKMDHAYLFVGQKDRSWELFFKWLRNKVGNERIATIAPIKKTEQGSVHISIDAIRAAIKELSYTNSDEGRRWIMIDDAHTMNEEASNALLKALEEPPERAHFLLTAPHERTLLPTIASRCGIIRIPPGAAEETADMQRYRSFFSLSPGEQLAFMQKEDFFNPQSFEFALHSLGAAGNFEAVQRLYGGLRAYYHGRATLGESFARDSLVLFS